jgi:hypothetical protein
MRMATSDRERREILNRNGPLTPRQAAIAYQRDKGLTKVRKILSEPLDPERIRKGLSASRRALRQAHHK